MFLVVILLIAFVVVGIRFVKAYMEHDALHRAVPPAHVVTQGDKVFRQGQSYFPKDGTLMWDLTEDVFTFRNTIVIWKPDVENFVPYSYLKPDGVRAKLKEILVANPKADLKKYTRSLGIVVVEAEEADRESTSIIVGRDSKGEEATLPYSVRNSNCYIAGVPDMGKSTLLMNMARQDIENGKGVAVLDPHQDLIDQLIRHVPAKRQRDVILFDKEHLWGINLFDYRDEEEKLRLVRDITQAFSRLSREYGEWGVGMNDMLSNAILSLIATADASFTDAYYLLTDDAFRKKLIVKLQSSDLANYWLHEFPKTPIATKQAVTKRLRLFVTNPILRHVFSEKEHVLDFHDLLQQRRVLLAKLSDDEQGLVIGSMIVAKLQQIALRRGDGERIPFYLYIDEFQTMTSADFMKIFTQGRKFNLCMTVANQGPADISDTETERGVWKAQTYIVFRQDHKNANQFRGALGEHEPNELYDLPRFEALFRSGAASNTKQIRSAAPPPPRDEYRIPPPIAIPSSDSLPASSPSKTPSAADEDDFRPTRKPSSHQP
jgi:hypothetical protein